MVVDQIPYLKTFIPQNSPLLNGALMNPTTANLNLQGANGGVVVPGIPGTGTSTTAAGAGTATLHVVQVGDDDTDSEVEECALAGCTNSRYVDANGVESSYCSQRHRQQAVASGTIDPCIFCGVNPQSDGDYFCSRECREEALDKAKAGGHGGNGGGGAGDDEVQGLGKGGDLKQ
ncbi:hypothetical protein D9758_008326 [Tetrapyrgos nigripes]|nr:hypothetical protein D9758_008326 [Tetrapyrgos nigripes]